MVQFNFSKQFLQSIDRAFQKYFWGKSTSSKDINYKKNIKSILKQLLAAYHKVLIDKNYPKMKHIFLRMLRFNYNVIGKVVYDHVIIILISFSMV